MKFEEYKNNRIFLVKELLPGNCRSSIFLLLGVLIVTLLSFLPTFFNGFQSGWDDQWMVTNFFTSGGFSYDNIRDILLSKYGGQYAPVNQLFYTIIYTFVKYRPFYYHACCLLLHLINTAMVYTILLKLYKWDLFNYERERRYYFALFSTLCFAINPLQVESVAWVSASKVVLYSTFYLIGTWTYISYIEKNSIIGYIMSFLCYILALGSKEQSVVFPFWLMLLHWSHGDYSRDGNRLLGVIPFFLIGATFSVLYLLYASELDGNLANIAHGKSLLERVEIAGFAISIYVRRWFIPIDMQHIYRMPETIPGWFILCPICISIIIIACWKNIKGSAIFWAVFFLIHIGLSLHLIPMGRFVIMADRYMYLACIAVSNIFLILIGTHITNKKVQFGIVGMLFIWCIITFMRTQDWKDTKSIRANNSILIKII